MTVLRSLFRNWGAKLLALTLAWGLWYAIREDLEDVLGEILRTCPPIFCYLHAVEEEFSQALMCWMGCKRA